MLSVGIDTHQKMHEVEVQNEEEKTMWKGRIGNDKEGLDTLAEKLSVIEMSNNQKIVGIYINPTGNYHVPLQHFLQSNGYRVVAVNPIISANARKNGQSGQDKERRRRCVHPCIHSLEEEGYAECAFSREGRALRADKDA